MTNLDSLTQAKEPATESVAISQFEHAEVLADYLRQSFMKKFLMAGVDVHDAEDLCQQCIVQVLEFFDRFDASKGTIESWSTDFSKNALRNHWRSLKQKVASEVPVDLVPTDLVVEGEDQDDAQAIAAAMEGLNVMDREFITMRFSLGMSFTEIAQSANITEVAARKRVSRAVEQLRRHPAMQASLA